MNAQESGSDLQSARETIEQNGIHTVLLGGCDINGIFRGKRVPAWRFLNDPNEAMHFADVQCVMDWVDDIMPTPSPEYTGWWPSWERGFGDMEGRPDLSTLRLLPWAEGTAIVLLDYFDLHGEPLHAMPRNVLRRVDERAQRMGLSSVMTAELEFMVFNETPESLEEKDFRGLVPISSRPVTYGIETATRFDALMFAIRQGVEGLGIPIEAYNSESGPGQFELNLTPSHVLTAADQAFLFKHATRQIALERGHIATFMSKLAQGGFGSSCHVHQSLNDANGTNVFWDANDPDNLSLTARQYIAGLLNTMREFSILFAPTINSYKRFEPESAAGATVAWGVQSKAVGIRAVNESPKGCRIEHRVPGADANPYLAMAGMLAGGLAAIEQDMKPIDEYQGNSYVDPNVRWVPRTLGEAVDLFEQSETANEYLGEEAVRYLVSTRRWEIEQFNAAVHSWEFRRYFTMA